MGHLRSATGSGAAGARAPATAGSPSTSGPPPDAASIPGPAGFGSTLVLTVVLALAAIGLVVCAVMLVVDPTPIVTLGVGQRQDAETGLYLLAFCAILPAALLFGPRAADRIARGPNARGLGALSAVGVGGLIVAVLAARVADSAGLVSSGFPVLAPALVLWWALAGVALARAARPPEWPLLIRAARLARALWTAAAVLAAVSTLTVVDTSSVNLLGLGLSALAAAGAVWFAERTRSRAPSRLRRFLWLDALALGLILLAIPDLVVLTPEAANQSLLEQLMAGVMQFHHNFLLGPANQVGGGDPMLVDTSSQYGVGSILFLAAWFKIAPIGYGTFALLDGLLSALYFAGGYVLLRLAGVSRLAAGGTLAVAIVLLVLNRIYPVGVIPQEGPLRFGLPMALVLAVAAAARRPAQGRAWIAAEAAVLALSSLWAFEAFAMTAFTWLALVGLRAWLAPTGARRRRAGWLLAAGTGACLAIHLAFALGTLAVSGELPDWGQYLAFLDAFLFGSLGDLTYDFAPWSGGLAIGVAQIASAAALALLVRRRPRIVRGDQAQFLALAGLTAYGVVLFDYFVNRSAEHVLPYVCLPLLLSGALWIRVVRTQPGVARPVRIGALALPLAVTALLVAVAWSSIGPRFGHSALAYAVPFHKSMRDATERLWHFPPIDAASPQGEALLARDMPGQRRVPVLLRPGLDTEVLTRSGRVNLIPIADPWEDGFVARERTGDIRAAIARMEPGQRLLLDEGTLQALSAIHRRPELDPLRELLPVEPRGTGSRPRQSQPGSPTAPIQVYALKEIDRRFTVRIVERGPGGFVVAALAARR